MANTLSPAAAYKIGRDFKELARANADGKLSDRQQAAHVLAHTILGAAVAAAGGNDPLAGGLAAGGAEYFAPKVSKFLYGTDDPAKLTAGQKDAVANILGFAGIGVGAALGGGSLNAVQGGLNAEGAVENNSNAEILLQEENWDNFYNSLSPKEQEEWKIAFYRADERNLKLLYMTGEFLLDNAPYIGNAKALAEAETKIDYALSLLPIGSGIARKIKAIYDAAKRTGNINLMQQAMQQIGELFTAKPLQMAATNGAKVPPATASQSATKSVGGGKLPNTQKVLTDGSHLKRGGKLQENVRYKAGEFDYFYETDELGRIKSFETDNLQLTSRKQRLSHNNKTPDKVKGQDHAGHLIGDRFGGSPKLDNLLSQHEHVNLSNYKKIENAWEAALKSGKNVKIQVSIKYATGTKRPTRFVGYYWIDGKRFRIDIDNL